MNTPGRLSACMYPAHWYLAGSTLDWFSGYLALSLSLLQAGYLPMTQGLNIQIQFVEDSSNYSHDKEFLF
jgi:hypothetical protein